MKEIVRRDFSYCPRCGSKLLYLISNYQLAVPGYGGTSIEKILGCDKDITAVCENCNHRIQMCSSIYGITPKKYSNLLEDKEEIEKNKKDNNFKFIL